MQRVFTQVRHREVNFILTHYQANYVAQTWIHEPTRGVAFGRIV